MKPQTVYPERIIPEETPPGILALHLKRYQFAREYVRGKRVLDMGCGVGYGASYLTESCRQVVAADTDQAALVYAKQNYDAPSNINFIQADAMRMGLAESGFDVVCSFEMIEHVPDVNLYLREVKRVLTPGGVFIVSTPQGQRSDSQPANPHHYREWCASEFKLLLYGSFTNVELFGQSRRETGISLMLKQLDVLKLRMWLFPTWLTRWAARVSGVRAMADLHLDDVLIRRGDLRHASEIVAIASDEDYQY